MVFFIQKLSHSWFPRSQIESIIGLPFQGSDLFDKRFLITLFKFCRNMYGWKNIIGAWTEAGATKCLTLAFKKRHCHSWLHTALSSRSLMLARPSCFLDQVNREPIKPRSIAPVPWTKLLKLLVEHSPRYQPPLSGHYQHPDSSKQGSSWWGVGLDKARLLSHLDI